MLPLRRLLTLCLVFGAFWWVPPAQAAGGVGTVRGAIIAAGQGNLQGQIRLFTDNWGYLGTHSFGSGLYSMRLSPGTYRLQFTDRRAAYDVSKLAPADIRVTVTAGRTTAQNVRMYRGGSIVGTVWTPAGKSRGARIVAVNTAGQSFAVYADRHAQYAVGGLPRGSYSVYTYERTGQWTVASTWVPNVQLGQMYNRKLLAKVRAGRLLVDLYGAGAPVNGSATVTVISAATGQFWTARSSRGSVVFSGLYPGRYRIEASGVGDFLPASGVLRTTVRSGAASFTDFTYPVQGGQVRGRAVDATHPKKRLAKALAILYNAGGQELARARANAQGRFVLRGQLTTANGLSVVVHPDPDTGGWHQVESYCPFRSVRRTGISLVTGRTTDLGYVLLSRKLGQGTPAQCRPKPPKPDPEPKPPITVGGASASLAK